MERRAAEVADRAEAEAAGNDFCSESCVSRVYFFFPRGPAKSRDFRRAFFST